MRREKEGGSGGREGGSGGEGRKKKGSEEVNANSRTDILQSSSWYYSTCWLGASSKSSGEGLLASG